MSRSGNALVLWPGGGGGLRECESCWCCTNESEGHQLHSKRDAGQWCWGNREFHRFHLGGQPDDLHLVIKSSDIWTPCIERLHRRELVSQPSRKPWLDSGQVHLHAHGCSKSVSNDARQGHDRGDLPRSLRFDLCRTRRLLFVRRGQPRTDGKPMAVYFGGAMGQR